MDNSPFSLISFSFVINELNTHATHQFSFVATKLSFRTAISTGVLFTLQMILILYTPSRRIKEIIFL